MCNFAHLSHIVDGYILPTGTWVWVVCTCTRTRVPDGYMMLPICVPAGRNIISYLPLYRVKPVGYSGFGYPLPSQSRIHKITTRITLIITCSSHNQHKIHHKFTESPDRAGLPALAGRHTSWPLHRRPPGSVLPACESPACAHACASPSACRIAPGACREI
jgi:hypothetical protein